MKIVVKKIIKLKVDSEYLIYDLQEVFDSAVKFLMPESKLKEKLTKSFLKEFQGKNGLINPLKPLKCPKCKKLTLVRNWDKNKRGYVEKCNNCEYSNFEPEM